jgi:K+-transporting ATPase KdpF subunit
MTVTMIILSDVSVELASCSQASNEMNNQSMYVLGAVIGFLIFVYLLFVLIKPEKF